MSNSSDSDQTVQAVRLRTFEQLHQNKDEVFERGVINVFKGLSWDYKTNSPCKFGSKIIVNNLVRWDQWGFHLISGMQADRLADLERMLHLLSGKPIPDNRGNITMNRPDFPGECFICELRLPDHCFRWKHNELFLLLPEEYGPAFPAIVDCYTSPPT